MPPRDPFPERRLLPYDATPIEARRLLVLAPHADDETLGCGGLVAALLAGGTEVHVLVVTDGAGGEPDPARRRATGERRLEEVREALRRLGGGSARCAFLPDRGLLDRIEEVERLLEEVLLDVRPDLVAVPSPVEVHPDHRAVAAAFLELTRGEKGRRLSRALPPGARVALFEVSQPLRPNALVDVSDQVERKEAAVAAFASQLAARDYAAYARGLGAYRTMSLPDGVRAAEAYFLVPLAELAAMPRERLARALGPTLAAADILPSAGAVPQAPPVPEAAGAPSVARGDDPLVTVVIRTRDRPRLLEEALASVAAQEGPFEAVVVNDGGVDVSGVVARFPELEVRRVDLAPGRGRVAAANAGIAAARGRFVHFLDDDDVLLPGGLARLLAEASENEVVYGRVEAFRYEGHGELAVRLPFHTFAEPFREEALLLENFIPFNAPLLPAASLRAAGGLDETLERFEDWDLFLRLSRDLRFRFVDVPVAEYRVFPSSFIDDPDAARTQHAHRVAVLARHAARYGPESLSRILLHVRRDLVPAEVAREAGAVEGTFTRALATADRERAALAAELERTRAEASATARRLRTAEVSVVIVNYNGRHHLEKCLPALLGEDPAPGEVIVVDNGSSDGSVAFVKERYPEVRLLDAGANLGFGEANRRGALAARGAYLVLLNSDTEVEPGWLLPLIDPLRQDASIGATCSVLRLMATPNVLNGLGGGMTRLGYGFDHRYRFPVSGNVGEPGRVDDVLFPTAAAMAMRRGDFFDCGGFDPAFFMYHEDVDLGVRLWTFGKRVVVCHGSFVRHAFLGTSKAEKGLEWRARLGLRHDFRSLIKHLPPLELAKVARWHVVTLLRASAYRLLGHALLWNLKRLPGTLRERRRIRERTVLAWDELKRRGLLPEMLYAAPDPEPERFKGGEGPERWIVSDELRPGDYSGDGRLGWGFYGRDDDGGGLFRWTCGSGRFVLRVGPSRGGRLRLETRPAPAASHGELRVSVSGHTTSFPIDGPAWLTVEVPCRADDHGLLDVVVTSPASVPHDTYRNWDFRRLGAGIRSVRFLPDEPEAPAPPPGTVSVVIPTYNRWDILKETLEALARQTTAPHEVIVVDDGSTDGTGEKLPALAAELAGRLRVLPLRQPNLKQGRARNLGIAHATGELVLFLGDDTIPEPGCVAEHLAAHRRRGAACAVIGYTGWHEERMRVTPFLHFVNGQGAQFSFDVLADGAEVPFTNLYTSNVSLPRTVLGTDPFDLRFQSYGWEDVELGWRLSQMGLPIVYHRAAATRHVHPQTLGQFVTRQRHVGRAIQVLFDIHPDLEGNPLLPPPRIRWRHRNLGPLYRVATGLSRVCDRAGIGLPYRLYDAILAYAFQSGRLERT